jgi:rhodanese-related sulfurtransferase
LYWTIQSSLRTVSLLMKFPARLLPLFFSFFFAAQAQAGQASAVSADDAHTAIAQGAYVMDVRPAQQFAAGHLPLAAALPANAAALPVQELAALLTMAGVDSSRTMLVVGDAGDTNAQALWQRLARVTSGRVLWLVGGVQEWQMRGHALTTQIEMRLPVPQFLTPFDAPTTGARMAGSKMRTSALLESHGAVKLALN